MGERLSLLGGFRRASADPSLQTKACEGRGMFVSAGPALPAQPSGGPPIPELEKEESFAEARQTCLLAHLTPILTAIWEDKTGAEGVRDQTLPTSFPYFSGVMP